MSKEPEDLDISVLLKFIDDWLNRYDVCNVDYNFYKIKQALQHLESIDNANPNEVLKDLQVIENNIIYLLSDCDTNEEVEQCLKDIKAKISTIKDVLLKAQEFSEILKEYHVKDLDELNTILSDYRKHWC